MSAFLDMGGYAAFVWPAYALTLIIVVANVLAARRALTCARRSAQRRLQVQQEGV
jgi:heme exporter protein D